MSARERSATASAPLVRLGNVSKWFGALRYDDAAGTRMFLRAFGFGQIDPRSVAPMHSSERVIYFVDGTCARRRSCAPCDAKVQCSFDNTISFRTCVNSKFHHLI
jgi:hypothetical protein